MTVPLPSLPGSVNTSDQPWSIANWFVTGNDGSIPGLANRTQANVTTTLQNNVQNSPGWNASSLSLCSLITGNPILGGLSSMGTGSTPTGLLLSGVQALADALCGIFTGSSSTGTSPATILTGVQSTTDAANTLVTGTSTTGNSVLGVLGLFTTLLDDFCTLFTGTTSTGTSGNSILSGFTSVFGLLNSSPLFSELSTLGGSASNILLNLLNGVISFADSLCTLFTGTTSTGTAPSTVLGGAQTFIDTIFNLVTGGSSTGNSGTSILTEVISLIDSFVGLLGGSGTGNPLSALFTVAESFLSTFFGIFGGATGLGGVGSFFTSLLGAFGGASSVGGVGSFITNLLGAFGGASSVGGVGSFITSLLGAFGGASSVGGVGSFITGLLGSFGGAANLTQVGNFLTNLLSIFGTPALTGSPGLFNPAIIPGGNIIGTLLGSVIPGLNANKITSGNFGSGVLQNLLDTISAPLGGGTGLGFTDFGTLFSRIPPGSVLGAGGLPDIGNSVTSTWDSLVNGFTGILGSGFGLADVANGASALGSAANLSLSNSAANTNTLAIQDNKSVSAGLEATVESNMPIASLGTGAAPTLVTATQAVSVAGFHRVQQAKTLGFHQWWGYKTGTVTGFYLNFAKMNAAGTVTPLFSSADQSASLSTTGKWNVYSFPGVDEIAAIPGDVILVEHQVVGSGSLSIGGLGQTWQTNHPTANTQRSGFTRNTGASGPTTLSSSFTNTGNTPYIGLGVSNLPANYQPPETTPFTVSGTFTAPAWQMTGDLIDFIPLGAGGGGGGSIGYGFGNGGSPGVWGGQTLTCGTDYVPGTVFTITIGAHGNGGGYGASGTNGTATTISWTDPSSTPRTITVAGGLAGGTFGGYSPYGITGEGPGPHTFAGVNYAGGSNVGSGATGSAPGGGGGGAFSWLVGGPGADGAAWVVARQQ